MYTNKHKYLHRRFDVKSAERIGSNSTTCMLFEHTRATDAHGTLPTEKNSSRSCKYIFPLYLKGPKAAKEAREEDIHRKSHNLLGMRARNSDIIEERC